MTTLSRAVFQSLTATPPVSRIDAKRGQTIKLMYTASTSLPKDRESVSGLAYWKFHQTRCRKVANQSLLQLAFGTRKTFLSAR
ncbi:fimbria/pilus periplasmic chaperone [Shigella flexneri]